MRPKQLDLEKRLQSHDDLLSVRSELLAQEASSGIGALHGDAIRLLKGQGARLVHGQAHLGEVVAFAICPRGRTLATGSWVNDDYERGGMILVWDIEMGRCVNVLDPIEGGVGWPEYPHCLRFTQDGEKLGVAFNTNSVGLFDPFGASPEPLAYADVTDGWSRPPAFCLMPDGKHAFISCWRDAKVPGALVSLEAPARKARSKRPHVPTIQAMAKTIPAKMRKLLKNGHLEPPKEILPSSDGKRVHCINSHGFAFAITLDKGELDYLCKVGLPAAYSPDGRFLAHTLAGLVIYDGATGLPTTSLPMHVGMNALHWGKRGETMRLAGVVAADNEFEAEPSVHIYDQNTYRYSIDVKPREPSWDDGDFAAFAWSPSGERAAVLDEENRLHLVSLGERVVVERVVEVREGLRGVFWASPEGSSREIVILASRDALVFLDADTGEITGEHFFCRAPEVPRPLDTGSADLADPLRPDPTFAVDEETWGAAFSEGVVIAPPSKLEKLDAHLAWSIDRRHAFPARWGGLEVFASAAEVAQAENQPPKVNWKKFKPAKSRKASAVFPPPNPTTLGPMYEAVLASVKDLSRGWSSHVAENLRFACLLRARSGEIAEALAMVEHIPDAQESLCCTADLTAIAYRKGQGALLDAAFAVVQEDLESGIQPHTEVLSATSMFSAHLARKEDKLAEAWLARAKAALKHETNPWQYRLTLLWGLVQAGYEKDARALFADKAVWMREPLCFYSEPFAVAMVREGHIDLLFDYIQAWKQHRHGSLDWSFSSNVVRTLAHYGHPSRLKEAQERLKLSVSDESFTLAKSRENMGHTLPSPSAADIETLTQDFTELQKTPRARRAPGARTLLQKAARMGHSGAVLALLPELKDTDFNDRPTAALQALWMLTTGFDIVPW